MAEGIKRGLSFPRKRIRSKSRFVKRSKSPTREGIRFRRYFIKGRSFDVFDNEFEQTPRIYHYASKLRKALMRDGKIKGPEEYKPDVFARFMAYIRKKLWVVPSSYQKYLYSLIAESAPTRYKED